MSLNTLPADRLPAVLPSAAVAARSGTAIAVRLRLPSRRSATWLAATGTLAVAAGASGSVLTAANGPDVGGWLLAAAGVTGAAALLQAADLHRRPK